jgi:ornithine cyclodeaminase/alanine dehydrogenase-like protein (mu-crystallin family)
MGSNFLAKCEVDVETIRRASIIAVDSVEQSKIEAGDLLPAIERGVIFWESVNELGRIVAGQVPGRRTGEEITMFKSNGIALWDIAVAKVVYERALERKAGEYRPMWENR